MQPPESSLRIVSVLSLQIVLEQNHYEFLLCNELQIKKNVAKDNAIKINMNEGEDANF